ncbi:MAG TPA: hypothetical protein VK155_10995 [Bacteroidales bacterium]|jgi:hypothetical protein|nr:hypothetical protein [Bacteroidales bacterium]
MKKIFLFAAFLAMPFFLTAQDITQEHNKLIDDHLQSKLSIEKEPVKSPDISKVFAGSFYKVRIDFIYQYENSVQSYGCHDCYVNITNGKLTEFQQLSSDGELKELLSMLKSEFRIRNEADAKVFEAALNALYPVDQKDVANIKHMNKAAQWIFIRGKFFDDNTAVIVSVAPDGRLSKIELMLSYQAS